MPPSYTLSDGETFDYIVVGAGAGGSAAAARLALAGHSVLLVEAGGDPTPLTKVPAAAMLLMGSHLDWKYKTISNNVSCLGSEGQQCHFARGKCLGGSTTINYMVYVRGNRRDYDLNLTGWTWDDLKPFFLRYEGLQDLDKLPPSSIPYHNTSGTMRIEFFDDPQNHWHEGLKEAFQNLGFPYNYDVNAESQIGVTQLIGYVYKGERMSTARAYLTRKDVTEKLRVAKRTRCTGVIIDENNEAQGVTVVPDLTGQTLRLYARYEVVLSAGTIGTPQILMLSGVGHADHLNSFNITVHSDLPVGDNMSDHALPFIYITSDQSLLSSELNVAKEAANLVQWLAFRNGTAASNGIVDIAAFLNTQCYDSDRRQLINDRPECELPTTQFGCSYFDRGIISVGQPLHKKILLLNDDINAQVGAANAKSELLILTAFIISPFSRGTVRLASGDPFVYPAIFPNYLSDERDVDELLRGITIIEHLVETPVFRKRNAAIVHLKLPGCPNYEDDRVSYWRCYVRHVTSSAMHAAGTCALGAALDARLRVRGVRRVRVADLSALPAAPRGNTAAAAIALGERVAHMLLQDNL